MRGVLILPRVAMVNGISLVRIVVLLVLMKSRLIRWTLLGVRFTFVDKHHHLGNVSSATNTWVCVLICMPLGRQVSESEIIDPALSDELLAHGPFLSHLCHNERFSMLNRVQLLLMLLRVREKRSLTEWHTHLIHGLEIMLTMILDRDAV